MWNGSTPTDKEVIGEDVVSNNTSRRESVSVKRGSGRAGKINFNPRKMTFEISLTGTRTFDLAAYLCQEVLGEVAFRLLPSQPVARQSVATL